MHSISNHFPWTWSPDFVEVQTGVTRAAVPRQAVSAPVNASAAVKSAGRQLAEGRSAE